VFEVLIRTVGIYEIRNNKESGDTEKWKEIVASSVKTKQCLIPEVKHGRDGITYTYKIIHSLKIGLKRGSVLNKGQFMKQITNGI
jgi:hypothetical protein